MSNYTSACSTGDFPRLNEAGGICFCHVCGFYGAGCGGAGAWQVASAPLRAAGRLPSFR